jgi:hypothetical protein
MEENAATGVLVSASAKIQIFKFSNLQKFVRNFHVCFHCICNALKLFAGIEHRGVRERMTVRSDFSEKDDYRITAKRTLS